MVNGFDFLTATAIHFGLTLVTADNGFKNIPKLDVIILDLH
jgi:predicted nucleic acid-binding protein